MGIAPNFRIVCWSAALLSFLVTGSLWGQQNATSPGDGFATAFATDSGAEEPTIQIGFVPNWKTLIGLAFNGIDVNDPRKRFFVSYEQMLFSTSPALAGSSTAPTSGHAGQQTMSPNSMPAFASSETKSFSATALENLGTGAFGSLVPNLGSGSRLEFGRMETDNTGWSASILDLNSSGPNAQSPDGIRAAHGR